MSSPVVGSWRAYPKSKRCRVRFEQLVVSRDEGLSSVVTIETPRTVLAGALDDELRVVLRESGAQAGVVRVDLDVGEYVSVYPFVDTHARQRGLMTEVKYWVLRYCFYTFNVKESVEHVPEANVASMALHLKLGYLKVGQSSEYVILRLTREDFDRLDRQVQEVGFAYQPFLPRAFVQATPLGSGTTDP